MEQILLAYGLANETVAAIMMQYKNTKVKVRSSDGDIDNFDIVAGELQGDTLALYQFIIGLDYTLRTFIDLIKENGKKKEAEDTRTNNYGRGLHRWHSASGEYTCSSRIPAT